MSQPAARMGDPTSHGGAIVLGLPTVLIGGQPAARVTDMHACPMVTGIVPHVGGPIVMGSATVLVGMLPQARMGDQAVCVGPPDSIVMGAPTVLVGMGGGGGGGGGGAGGGGAGGASAAVTGASVSGVRNPTGGTPSAARNDDGSYTLALHPWLTLHGDEVSVGVCARALTMVRARETGREVMRVLAATHVTLRLDDHAVEGASPYDAGAVTLALRCELPSSERDLDALSWEIERALWGACDVASPRAA